jgi:hypothetical protein
MLKRAFIIFLMVFSSIFLICGCGTTLKEDFDQAPAHNNDGPSNVPNIAKINVTTQAQQIIITGYDTTVESQAKINVYSEGNTLLNSGSADSRGAFQITIADDPSLNAVEITSVAQNKLESPKARIEL